MPGIQEGLNRCWGDETNTFGIHFASVITWESLGPRVHGPPSFHPEPWARPEETQNVALIVLSCLKELPSLSSAQSQGLPVDSFHTHGKLLAMLIKKTFGRKVFSFFFFPSHFLAWLVAALLIEPSSKKELAFTFGTKPGRIHPSPSGSSRFTEACFGPRSRVRWSKWMWSQEYPLLGPPLRCLTSQRGSYGPSDKVVRDVVHMGSVEWQMSDELDARVDMGKIRKFV